MTLSPNGRYRVEVTGARGDASTVPGPPGTVTDASGFLGALAVETGNYENVVVRAEDAVPTIRASLGDAYAGVGTGTEGAGRYFFGTLTPSGDDSAICVGRKVRGTSLFSHAFRDESTFASNLDSAYTAFDARHTYVTNSGAKYNHGYAAQASHQMSAANGMDLFAGFVTFPRVTAGTVDRLYHFHVQGMTKTGGTVTQHVGLYISPLSGGEGEDYAIFQESADNPNFFGGNTQFGGNITGVPGGITTSGQVNAAAVAVTGSPSTFPAAGGVVFFANDGPAAYGGMRAVADNVATPKGLVLQRTGGQVLIGKNGVAVTGESLEVEGLVGTDEGYRVDGIKVVSNQQPALPANATDDTTAWALINAIKASLIAHGLNAAS